MTDPQPIQNDEATAPVPPGDAAAHEAETMKKQAEEYLNGWKRAKADLLNYQREIEKRQRDLLVFAHAGAVTSFLPLYESFEHAWAHVPADLAGNEWVKGLSHVRKQCMDLLKEWGVERIETKGQPFSVESHEAVGRRKQEGALPDTIVEEVQAGYTMHGKVLRPAKVIVAEETTATTT
ncbi:nucleotide exchange factor GrpE [Candidatus Uhrbacteria bacterium]|nr:nucleotide exchange factor GrpE [Candidatus Uhrbacteria bacterium]